jgi:probable selenium-dependent hydroxylase accessory protein YqeC
MLAELLEICPGITAVIGGGGKTTLLRTLGEELAQEHRVLLCTTTKILPFAGIPCAESAEALEQLRKQHRLLCAGQPVNGTGGKLTTPPLPLPLLAEWFDYVLVEADGSAGRPMKAHAPHEPVIPPAARQTICVVGFSGFGQAIQDAAHRPERYAALAKAALSDPVTPEREAAVLRTEALHDRVFLNQIDSPDLLRSAKHVSSLLETPVVAGSLQKGAYWIC